MITKLLDGLEMFLGVGVMFLNSSNLEIPGRWLGDVLGCGVARVIGHRCNRSVTAQN